MSQEEARLELEAHLRLGPLRAHVRMEGVPDPEMLTAREFERRLGPLRDQAPPEAAQEDLSVALKATGYDWPRPGQPQFYELTARHSPEGWRLQRVDLDASLELSAMAVQGECASRLPALEECLRLLTWLHLTGEEHAGLLVHSACAVRDGEAYCFPAYGGTGKSTLIRLTPGDVALSDELALLTRDKDQRWWAWPSPFWNWGANLAAGGPPVRAWPLGGLGFLSPATLTSFAPVRVGEALTRLMEQTVAFDHFPVRSGRTFELAADLVEEMHRQGKLGMVYLRKGDDPYGPMCGKSP